MEGSKKVYSLLDRKKKEREERKKETSKQILISNVEKKIKTTMIGSINAIEKEMDFLWKEESDEKFAIEMQSLFQEVRKKILDLGNEQIRRMKAEFEGYDIEWNMYETTILVKPQGNGGSNE